jgi:hypothetical protein
LSAALQEVAAQLLLLNQGMSDLAPKQEDPSPCAQTPLTLDRATVVDWIHELESQNFSAVKRFAVLKSALAVALGTERMSELTTAMDGLEFERALAIVRPWSGLE